MTSMEDGEDDTTPRRVGFTQPVDREPLFTWPCWWGGSGAGDTEPDIVDKKIALRRRVGGLQAKSQSGTPYPVKSAKDLHIRLRDALDEERCSYSITDLRVENIPVVDGTMALVQALVRLEAPDGSYCEGWGCGHGASVPQGEKRRGADDKAAGKAITYSVKVALIHLLSLPDAEMEDTDDEVTPAAQVTAETVRAALRTAQSREALSLAGRLALALSSEDQLALSAEYQEARTRVTGAKK